LKRIFRFFFRKFALCLVGTGISKNKFVYNIIELLKKILKPKFIEIDGCNLLLDETDRHGFTIYGNSEERNMSYLKKIVMPGQIVVDVGANIGIYSVVLAKWVGKQGHVFAFEPAPDNIKLLRKTIKLNQFDNITITQKAISNKPGIASFYLVDGISSHSLMDYGKSIDKIDVEVETLDNFFQDYEKPIDFIKIDAEGYDFKVILGMQNIISKTQNLSLFVEFDPKRLIKIGDSPQDLLRFMLNNRFSVKDLITNEMITSDDIEKTVERYMGEPHYTDLLCEKIS
jgi:FkbM family methyltransferase